jgi:hypothetical protein
MIQEKSYVCNITLPSVAGSQVVKDWKNTKCTIRGPNWATLTKAQCSSVGADWDGSYCVYAPRLGCDTANGWFNMTSPANFCGKN